MIKVYAIFFILLVVAVLAHAQDKQSNVDSVSVFDYKTHYRGSFPTIKAKIGKKEGVKLDQKYNVFWNMPKKDGTIKPVRMGVIRASNHIGDNMTDSTSYTQFYQISGVPLNNKMYMKKAEDIGIGVSAALCIPTKHSTDIIYEDEYGNEEMINNQARDMIYLKFDYNISPLIFKVAGIPFFTEVRLCAGIAGVGFKHKNSGTVTWDDKIDQATIGEGLNSYNSTNDERTTAYYFFGLSKDIHIKRNIKIIPFIQYFIGIENYTSIGFNGYVTIYKNFGYYMGFHLFYGYRPTVIDASTKDRRYFQKVYTDLIGFRFFL